MQPKQASVSCDMPSQASMSCDMPSQASMSCDMQQMQKSSPCDIHLNAHDTDAPLMSQDIEKN